MGTCLTEYDRQRHFTREVPAGKAHIVNGLTRELDEKLRQNKGLDKG